MFFSQEQFEISSGYTSQPNGDEPLLSTRETYDSGVIS